jgi:hypothetical protein
MRRRK